MPELQFIPQSWGFPVPKINQVALDISASQERRSKRLPGALLEVEEAGDFFDSLNLNTIPWGSHRAVVQIGFGDDPQFRWDESFPLETGYFFEHNSSDHFYGEGQAQVRYNIFLPHPWRTALDGPGIIVQRGDKGQRWNWNEDDLEYDFASEETQTYTFSIALSNGQTQATTAIFNFTELGDEDGLEVFPFPPAIIDDVHISYFRDGGGSSPGGFEIAPYESIVNGGPTAAGSECYSENRGGVQNDLHLTISYPASSEAFPTHVTFTKRTTDFNGTILSDVSDSVDITGAPEEVVIPAPGGEGRVYCFGFTTGSTRFADLPFVLASQVATEFAS